MADYLIIVESPFQLMAAYEYCYKHNVKGYQLLFLETQSKKNSVQFEKLLSNLKVKFHFAPTSYTRITREGLSAKFIVKVAINSLVEQKKNYAKILIGDYRSNYIRIIESKIKADTVVLDDGVALVASIDGIVNKDVSLISQTLVNRLISQLIANVGQKKYSVFSMLPYSFLKSICPAFPLQDYSQNKFVGLKAYGQVDSISTDIAKTALKEHYDVAVVGNVIAELNLVDEQVYIDSISHAVKKIKSSSKSKVLYVAHRREKISKIEHICRLLKCEFVLFENPLEYEVIMQKFSSQAYITSTSAAIYSLACLENKSTFYFVKLSEKYIDKNSISSFQRMYKLFSYNAEAIEYE